MKLVMGEINGVWLLDLMNGAPATCTRVTAAVAYATGNSLFFDHCLQNNRFLEFYGLLDEDQAVAMAVMEKLLAAGPFKVSCHLVKGHYHPKVIWWHGYGVYIGSANLTSHAWAANLECGVFYEEEEVLGTPVEVQLDMMLDRIRQISKPLDADLIKALKKLQAASNVVDRERSKLKDLFDEATKTFPEHGGLTAPNAGSKLSLFAVEWEKTLELLRGLRKEFMAMNLRPKWVAADANDTVHFDQFLHAYYYVRVREKEDEDDSARSHERVKRFFEKNQADKNGALRDAAVWWASLPEAPHGEDVFIAITAPNMRELFAKERIAAWTFEEFKAAMMGVNAFKMHARQVKNKFFGLPEGHRETLEQRAHRLADWLWNLDRTGKKSLRDMWTFLIWGTYPANMTERLWMVTKDEQWAFLRLGQSSLGEAVGWARPDDYPPRNNRTNKALRALGHGTVRQFSSE